VHVIRESSKNANLLFVGTEKALFVSLDSGQAWHRLKAGLPVVPIHDLVIHPRERDLVIGTHGRGVFVMDINPIEEMNSKILDKAAHIFSVRPALAYTPTKPETKSKAYVAPNPKVGATVYYHLQSPATKVTYIIRDKEGARVMESSKTAGDAGIHRIHWDLIDHKAAEPKMVLAGEYIVELNVDGETVSRPFRVEAE
jgi:hypothetical protein